MEHLGCEYLDEANGALRRTTELKFRWSFRGSGFEEAEETNAKCHYILDRGVPLPDAWSTEFRSLSSDEVAAASTKRSAKSSQDYHTSHAASWGMLKRPPILTLASLSLCLPMERV